MSFANRQNQNALDEKRKALIQFDKKEELKELSTTNSL